MSVPGDVEMAQDINSDLRRSKWVRSVGQGAEATWVWNGQGLTDEEWLRRLRTKFKPSFPRIRVTPPEAYVVIIGQAEG